MAVKQCSKCGKFIGVDVQDICEACKPQKIYSDATHAQISDPFVIARNLVYDNNNLTVDGLIQKMSTMGYPLTRKDVMQFVKEQRLFLKNQPTAGEGF